MSESLRVILTPRPWWYEDAACANAGVDPNTFFKARDSPITAVAERICRDCPVRKECYAHARDNNEQGIWGGKFFDRPR